MKIVVSVLYILLLAGTISACLGPSPVSTRTPLATVTPPTTTPILTPVPPERTSEIPSQSGLKTNTLSITNNQGKDVSLEVEVAATPQDLQTGLMWRASLPEMRGMLFDFKLYGDSIVVPFYMKNTFIPLSIAFVSGDDIIVDIQDMEPLTETLHYPAKAYLYALEVNQGWFERYGIQVGNRVTFK